ncbi:MAG TPA: VOC family protein [Bryobacteraceae bacterium]|nr:VOC family protein [Bryobacteraceae bacterium]
MSQNQQIVTNLWFDHNAEEAVNFYLSIFDNSRVVGVLRCGEAGPGPKGSVLTMTFELDGQEFIALNGGPAFKFSEAISLSVKCNSQEEVDRLWDKLLDGGTAQRCGWLKDKYGLSWQIVPAALEKMLKDGNPGRSGRVMKALMQMVKLDLKLLQQAYDER